MNSSSSTKPARTPRVWIEQEIPEQHLPTAIELPKRAAHHLFTVIRAQEDVTVQLFNGDGYNYLATVTGNGKKAQATVHAACLLYTSDAADE